MQSNNTLHSSKPTGMDSKNSTYAPNTSNPALPFWDNNEINKRLDEHAKLLIEWEELLNRTGGPEVTSISQQDATRHIVLKRKLHESLGVMARIVQNQLKMKKTPSDSAPSNTAPVMVSTAPAQNAYAQNQHQSNQHNQHPAQGQGQGAAHSNGMLLPSTGYQQGMDYAAANNNSGNSNNNSSNGQMHAQSMPMQYSNGGYNYQNNYVPTAQPGMAQPGQYYNYSNTAVPGQVQVQGQQMYVPQYQMNTSLPNANMSTMNTTLNPSTAMNTNMTGNTTNGVYGVAYTAYPAASYIPQHTNPAQAYTYNTSGAVYPGTDGASLLYSQQMLQQVPTSYYGNSSVANGGGVAGAGPSSNTTTNTNTNTNTNTTGTANVQQAPGQVQQSSTTHPTTHSSGYQSAPNLQQQQQQQQYHGLPSQHSQQSLPTTLPSNTANSNHAAHANTTHANTAHASSHAAHPVHTLPAHAAHTNYSAYSGDGQINAVMSMNPGMYNGAITSNVNTTSGGNTNTNTGGSQQ